MDLKKVREFAAQGLTIAQVAILLGRTYENVRRAAKMHDIPFTKSTRLSVVTKEALLDGQRRGLTVSQLAQELECPPGRVSTRGHRLGILLPGMKSRGPRTVKRVEAEDSYRGRNQYTNLPRPTPPQESPPSPALLRLAEFDSIARRAVARKSGQLAPGKEPDPDEEEI